MAADAGVTYEDFKSANKNAGLDSAIAPSWLEHHFPGDIVSWIGAAIAVVVFVAIGYAVFMELETVTWSQVRHASEAIGWTDIAIATGATALSYMALMCYDVLALRQVGRRDLPLRLVALTSFIAHALTFSLGFGALTGGAVRLRLYGSAGLAPEKVLGVGILCSLTFWMGLAAVTGVTLVAEPQAVHTLAGVGAWTSRGIGLAIIALIGGWIAWSTMRPVSVQVHGWSLPLPGTAAATGSILIGAMDTIAAALALWVLLPAGAEVSFSHFLVVFAVATVIGVVSHVPGGLGVFDGLIILGLPQVPEPAMLASLILFRLIYYVLPFILSAALLSFYEARQQSAVLHRNVVAVAAMATPLLPAVTATAVFIGGLVLLISGALPAEADRLATLRAILPLPFVEASHFFASIIGSLLLIIAHGLLARLRTAWATAIALLFAGATFSLAKGVDYEEAIICLCVIGLLLVSRRHFYRRGGIFTGRTSALDIVAIFAAVGISMWLGITVYWDVDYTNSLWWDFAYHGDAPRFLRASLGVAVLLLIVTVYHLVHRTSAIRHLATAAERGRAKALVATASRAEAHLAQLGDKLFLFSDDSFVMYGVQGSSWIAMGDPVASSPEDTLDLVWRYKELVDRHRGKPVFYQISSDWLPVYLDAGFSLIKLGEEAWVDLKTFTIEGGAGRKLRQTFAKAQRSDASVEIVTRDKLIPFIDELRDVSDEWLTTRGTAEKGFSLGFWSDDYMVQNDVAIVRHAGRIVAFANIWMTADKSEFTIDLMRHRPHAPPGVMDLLFITLMLEAKAQGYRWFNLGMAPLAGLPQHRLASMWSHLGTLFSRHADRYYNFEGLRAFKSKFNPEWRSKYLAYPGGLSLAQVLIDVVALIGESPKRAARRSTS